MCYAHEIIINNLKSGDIVHYSAVLIKGKIINKTKVPCQKEQICVNINNTVTTFFKIVDGKFKALSELKLGENDIILKCCSSTTKISINYTLRSSPFSVLPLYIICEGHDGTFQAPASEKNDIGSALGRIDVGVKLLQSVIAEKLSEEDHGRKTFQLENECQVFHSHLNYLDARKMTQAELWNTIGREIIAANLGHERVKFLGFLSCTWYSGEKYHENFTHDNIVEITEAYVALGGGGLALFGTSCLYTWPEDTSQVIEKFENSTFVDKRNFMDDSCYRGTLGACFSTTLGSVLHELCHTFDLGHTENGIMGRGFDNINKIFIPNKMVQESDLLREHQKSIEFEEDFEAGSFSERFKEKKKIFLVKNKKGCNEEDETFWTKSCLMFLAHHRWLNNNSCSEKKIKFDPVTKFVSSTAGLRVIEIRNEANGMVLLNWTFLGKILKYSFQIPEEELDQLSQKYVIFVEDDIGSILKHVVNTEVK